MWTSDKTYVLRVDKGPLPRLVKIHPELLTPRKHVQRVYTRSFFDRSAAGQILYMFEFTASASSKRNRAQTHAS